MRKLLILLIQKKRINFAIFLLIRVIFPEFYEFYAIYGIDNRVL